MYRTNEGGLCPSRGQKAPLQSSRVPSDGRGEMSTRARRSGPPHGEARGCAALQTGVERLTLQRQDAEDALVHTPKWFSPDEALQRLDPKREFT